MGFLRSYLEYARGRKKASLWMLFAPFHLVAKCYIDLRNRAYDHGVMQSLEPPLPVVSIGNLCLGGTNKTPMVEYFSRRFQAHALSVGIISRGYGGASKDPLWIGQNVQSRSRAIAGDEPLLLADKLPEARVVVAADRLRGISLLANLGADIVVADDAFQHRRMGRDVDIVLVDATCPLGNGFLLPAGILRDPPESLQRADLVILTKVEQISAEELENTKRLISRWVPEEKLFTARLQLDSWLQLEGGKNSVHSTFPSLKFFAFSAIGNPDSFHRSLDLMGVDVLGRRVYRDHHAFSASDLEELQRQASLAGAEAFVCTEKDLHNLPEGVALALPIWVPRIQVRPDQEERLWACVVEKLRPHCVVASNGYGEDAIGGVLATRLQQLLPEAKISAFSLVGAGKEYRERGIEVLSPTSEMPSAGLIKYSLRALVKDIRHGLRENIGKQIASWEALRGKIRTPLCVGDVYLALNALWGQGTTPLLLATAKTVYLSGHWRIERFFMQQRCVAVWTRDKATQSELLASAVRAEFAGNPIMDLAGDSADFALSPWGETGERVLLLPGSRPRAYADIRLLLDAAEKLAEKVPCQFVLVPAPTLDRQQLFNSLEDWELGGDCLKKGRLCVGVHTASLASAARDAALLIGLGGTANQVCAGLGVPVLSIMEKGKFVQKKLLADAEQLVPPTADELATAAEGILKDAALRKKMSESGIRRLGGYGALSSVLAYAQKELGWGIRHRVYSVLKEGARPSDRA